MTPHLLCYLSNRCKITSYTITYFVADCKSHHLYGIFSCWIMKEHILLVSTYKKKYYTTFCVIFNLYLVQNFDTSQNIQFHDHFSWDFTLNPSAYTQKELIQSNNLDNFYMSELFEMSKNGYSAYAGIELERRVHIQVVVARMYINSGCTNGLSSR